MQWFAAHLDHKRKKEKAKSLAITTTPEVLYKSWCGLLLSLPSYKVQFNLFCLTECSK